MTARAKVLLIDGSNVVHAVFGFWPETREQQNLAAEDFIAALSDWTDRQTDWDVEVVFDGGTRPLGASRTPPDLRVVFSGHASADDVILERARALRYFQKRVTIVTWDRALAQSAREEEAKVLDPQSLWRAVSSGARLGGWGAK
ncbi:MAG TPA: NYN domain-containing protein [Elusimicrobiota bacterium]|nr:NYN domain-containing protein [Elusimicrobiota bacterium]